METFTILKRVLAHYLFLSFAMPRIKNSKTFRDFLARWSKDNFSTQVKALFTAALADAKALFNFPDELMNDLRRILRTETKFSAG